MATYNAAAFLTPVLRSVVSQSFTDFRLIISDDASTDETIAICREFAQDDPRIRVYENHSRAGWIGNVDRALAHREGIYLMIAEHDDILEPDFLSSLVDALDGEPRAALAFTDMVQESVDGNRTYCVYDLLDGVLSARSRGLTILSREGPWWTCSRGLIPMDVFRHVRGFRRSLAGDYQADLPWLLRLAMAGQFLRVPRPLYIKRYQTRSLSKNWRGTPAKKIGVLLACVKAIWQSNLTFSEAMPLYRETVNGAALEMKHILTHGMQKSRTRIAKWRGRA